VVVVGEGFGLVFAMNGPPTARTRRNRRNPGTAAAGQYTMRAAAMPLPDTHDRRSADAAPPYSLQSASAALWPSTQHRLAESLVTELGRQAAAADESGQLSSATIDRLRRAGYFGLPVPALLQGGDAGLLECAAVQRRLATADPALSIAANMHLFSVGMAVEHWLRHRDSCGLILEAIATQHRIVASAFAEPGLGGALLRSTVEARRTGGGYVVTGIKSPCSLAACCDLVAFQMQARGEPSSLMTAFVPARLSGIRVEASWDALGMRASGSDTLHFEECFVPDELIFHRCDPDGEVDEVFAAGLVWFCVTTTATYLGIVHHALEHVRSDLLCARPTDVDGARGELATVQSRLGELVAGIVTIEAACAGVAAQMDTRRHDPRQLVPIAIGIKHEAVDVCARAMEGLAELAGGKSYRREALLARLWRDVQAARFHPPARLVSRRALGLSALGLPFSLDADRPSRDDRDRD
jgi:alkylation response protein AidB-like acyl-CoA dehydrogenase